MNPVLCASREPTQQSQWGLVNPVLCASRGPTQQSQWGLVNPVLCASREPTQQSQWGLVNQYSVPVKGLRSSHSGNWQVVKPEFSGRVAPATVQVAGSEIELSARVAVKLGGS